MSEKHQNMRSRPLGLAHRQSRPGAFSGKNPNGQGAARIAKNSFFILLSRIIEFGAGFAIVLLVANYLGVDRFGEFAFIRAVAFVLSPLIAFGSIRIIIREISIAKERTFTILTAGISLNLMMTFAVAAIASGVVFVFNIETKTTIASIYLAILAQMFLCMKTSVNASFFSHEIAKFAALTNIAGRLLVITAIVGVIGFHQDLLTIFIAIAGANFLGLAIAFVILKRTRILKGRRQRFIQTIGFLLKESYPVALAIFMVQGYTYMNTFFLRYFHDNWQVSMFEASQRLILPLSMIATSILLGFVPMLSRLGKDEASHAQLHRVYTTTLKYFFVIIFPLCIVVAVASEPIIQLIYKPDFSPAAVSLALLIWSIIPLFTNSLLNFVLTSLNKQKLLIFSNLACFLVNAALSWLLVEDFGYIGVCYAVFMAYAVLFACNYYFVSKTLGPARLISIMLVPGLVTGLCYGLIEITMVQLPGRFFGLLLYGIVYGIVIWFSGLVNGHELKEVIGPLRQKRSGGVPPSDLGPMTG